MIITPSRGNQRIRLKDQQPMVGPIHDIYVHVDQTHICRTESYFPNLVDDAAEL